jgi:hypothetical protein
MRHYREGCLGAHTSAPRPEKVRTRLPLEADARMRLAMPPYSASGYDVPVEPGPLLLVGPPEFESFTFATALSTCDFTSASSTPSRFIIMRTVDGVLFGALAFCF